MKDLTLHKYNDFNKSKDVLVSTVTTEGDFNSGFCTYNNNSNSTFYLNNAAITYVNKGIKYMMVNKQEFTLKEGDFLFIPKNSVVFTDIKVGVAGFQSMNILFPNDSYSTNSEPFAIYKNYSVIKRFKNVIRNDRLDHVELKKFIENILESFQELIFNTIDNNIILSEEISAISNMIVETIYDNISLPDMAEACNMSLATFKRKFTNEYGISPKTWIRNIRLQAAYFHLKTNRMNVTEVATLTNFDNLAHFSYTFKKYFNITPSSLTNK